MSETLSGWASRTVTELDATGNITTGLVCDWYRYHIGELNNALGESHDFDGSGFSPVLSAAESGIYQQMFYCFYYNREAQKALSTSFDWTLIQGDKHGMVRRASRSEQAKQFRSMAESCTNKLNAMITWYNRAKASPCQVLPAAEYYSPYLETKYNPTE